MKIVTPLPDYNELVSLAVVNYVGNADIPIELLHIDGTTETTIYTADLKSGHSLSFLRETNSILYDNLGRSVTGV